MMSDKKKKRGRPRMAPYTSYTSDQKMRNLSPRVIKKPKYLRDPDDESPSRGSTPSRSLDSWSNYSRGSHDKSVKKGLYGSYDKNVDFHYGSDLDDFESDNDKEKMNDIDSRSFSEAASDLEFDDDSDMVSDTEVEVEKNDFVPFWKLGPAGNLGYRPQTPVPVWLQDRKYPQLKLPDSSDDLLMPQPFVLKAFGIYEVLRHFRSIVRLSPFHFEDFCSCLLVNEQSILLSEIHITLIKSLIREEDNQQTHFGLIDQKDSTNIALLFVDSITWPETLRVYLESDKEFKAALDILNSCNYPFTSLSNRLQILQFLCDQFLQTTIAREDLLSEGKIKYDDHCRVCLKTGDLLCCDSCPAVYHIDCADPPVTRNPIDIEDWTCTICIKHNLEGVTDCSSLMETSGIMCRQEPIGYDRHGRKYWFLARRIIVEAEDGEVWYYSTLEQLDLLLLLMDSSDLEEALYVALKEFGDDIRRQMELTEKVTEKARGAKKSAISLESENTRIKIEELHEQRIKAKEEENQKLDSLIEEVKDEDMAVAKDETSDSKPSSETKDNKTEVKSESEPTTSSTAADVKQEAETDVKAEAPESDIKPETEEKGDGFIFPRPFLSSPRRTVDDDTEKSLVNAKIAQLRDGLVYRLGCDYAFRAYTNLYSSNSLALNKHQNNEERDKKRYMTHKFNFSSSHEFKWNGQCYGTKENQVGTVRQTILSLEQAISGHFFHPSWQQVRKAWVQKVANATSPQQFAKALLSIIASLKSVIFCNAWQESLGHITLRRMTALDREERKKQEKRERKEMEDESRYYQLVKFTKPVKHTLWKVKGEEYRLHGLWGWRWLASHRRVKHVSMNTCGLRAGPTKITIPIKSQGNVLRGLPVVPSAYAQLAAKNPQMQFSLLSPKQRREEDPNFDKEKKQANSTAPGQFEVSTVDLEEMFEDGVLNVSSELNTRLRVVYPKLCKESCLDSLLTRRLALKVQEEREIESFMKSQRESKRAKNVNKDDSIDVENDSEATLSENSDEENIDAIPDSQRHVMIHKQRPAGHLLKEMRQHKFKYEALDKADEWLVCYSPSCRVNGRNACYSPSCILKEKTKQKLVSSVNNYKIITNKPAPFDNVGSKSPVRLSDPDADPSSDPNPNSNLEASSKAKTPSSSESPEVSNSSASDTTELNNSPAPVPPSATEVPTNNTQNKDESKSSEDKSTSEKSDMTSESKEDDKEDPDVYKGVRTFSSEDTRGKIYLNKTTTDLRKMKKHKIPPVHHYRVNNSKALSLFILPTWELKILARKGGKYCPSGFSPTSKHNQHFWPYPCYRPFFKYTFLYKLNLLKTINSVAYHLRILWSCLRWDEMHERGPADGRKQITTDIQIVQTELLKRKIFGRFLERAEYLRRKVVIPLDVSKPVREFTPSQRSGLRKRRRPQSPVNRQPESTEEWVEEDKLDLWEIRFFGERLEKAVILSRKTAALEGNARSTSPADFKAKIEELKFQRASLNQIQNASNAKSIVKVAIANSNSPNSPNSKVTLTNAKLLQGSQVMTVSSKLPNVLAGRKIVTTKGGKIITVQSGAALNQGNTVSKLQLDGTQKIQLGKSSVIPISKVQFDQQGNKIIRLQNLGSVNQRSILPNTGLPTVTTSGNIGRTIVQNSTSPQVPNARSNTNQHLQILKLPDGQLQVRGLQEGQQLIQRPDGKLQIINTKLPSSSPGLTGQSQIQVTQQTKPAPVAKNSPSGNVLSVSGNQLVKINGQQVIIRPGSAANKQILTLNKDSLSNTPNITSVKKQTLKSVNLSDNKHLLTANEEKPKPSLPTPPTSPAKANQVSSNVPNTMTLRVQARMTEQGPKTIIQGLQPGVGLTKDHIMAIQQQVHSMVAQYNLQVDQVSPLMTLTLHVTKNQGQETTKDSSPGIGLDSGIKTDSVVSKDTQSLPYEKVDILGKNKHLDYLSVKDMPVSRNEDVEKLMNVQKFGSEAARGDSPSMDDNSLSQSTLKRSHEQEDDTFWMDQEHTDIVEKPKNNKRLKAERGRSKRDTNQSLVPTTTPKGQQVQDTRKKVVKQHKLEGMLTKHKDLLKKDILKKRALLEKELQLQIHKELSLAKHQMQTTDKNKVSDNLLHVNKKQRHHDAVNSVQSRVAAAAASLAKTKKNDTQNQPKTATAVPPKVPSPAKTAAPKKTAKNKSKKVVCICRTVFDDTKFYVGCDLCGNWFHGDCIGISEALSRSMTEYVCDECANAKLNKDLFCFCRQPYDETQFYICCEKCEDWYHGKCIGIMQLEADDIDDYICPKCDPANQWNKPCQKKLNNKDYSELKKLTKTLIQHKNAWPFLEPVDKLEVPDYYKVVKSPMALKVVESNVAERKYANLAEFVRDVMLVFDNCRAYNPPNSSFCVCANTLEMFFCSRLKLLKSKVMQKTS